MAKKSEDKPKKQSGIVVKFDGTRTVLSRWPVSAEEKAEIEAKRKG